jgi:hypothetical protein
MLIAFVQLERLQLGGASLLAMAVAVVKANV